MLAQDKYQAVTNEIEEIQEVRKKVDDMRVKFEKIKEKRYAVFLDPYNGGRERQ